MERTGRDVDRFLSALPDDSRSDMVALDRLIGAAMAGNPRELYEGRFWGGSDQTIIGYGRMSSQRSDGADVGWFVIGLARQKRGISVYVSAVEDGRYLAEARGSEVGKVKVGKSVISFRSLRDIDQTRLRSLIERARDLSMED